MPPLDQKPREDFKLRMMLYGPAHTRKTWLALTAAEAGFNVVVLNAEDNLGIVKHLSAEARKRIFVVDIFDSIDTPHAEYFISKFVKGESFLFDEQDKVVQLLAKTANPLHTFFRFNPKLLTTNTVIVLDTWTAYIQSLKKRYLKDRGIDLSKSVIIDSNWKDYRWTGTMADTYLENMKHFNCHMICVAHESNYEKREKEEGGEEKVIMSKMVPVSTSGNQSLRIAKYFPDILYFELVGDQVWIDPRPSADRDGGCAIIPQKKGRWDDFTFPALVKAGILPKPDGNLTEAIKFYAAGELAAEVAVAKSAPTVPISSQTTAQAPTPAIPSSGKLSFGQIMKT